MANKKVIGATVNSFNDITFKSKLEAMIYKTLLQEGFKVEYENTKFVLVEGFKPTVPFYAPNKKRELVLDSSKVRDLTYTPDFTMIHKGKLIVIEAKGFANDTYPIKKKLFRHFIEYQMEMPVLFFEIYTKKQLIKALEIIKAL